MNRKEFIEKWCGFIADLPEETVKQINKDIDLMMIDEHMPEFINGLCFSIQQDNASRGFWDEKRNVGELLMLVVSELGEAIEAHRKGKFASEDIVRNLAEFNNALQDPQGQDVFLTFVKDTFQDEIADAVIRLFDLAAGLGLDLGNHMKLKIAFNNTRERLHGKKY